MKKKPSLICAKVSLNKLMFATEFFSGIKGNAQKPSKQCRNMPAKLKIAALMPTYYSASRP